MADKSAIEPSLIHGHGHRGTLWPDEYAALGVLAQPGACAEWRRFVVGQRRYVSEEITLWGPGRERADTLDGTVFLNLLHDGYLGPPAIHHGGRSVYRINEHGRAALRQRTRVDPPVFRNAADAFIHGHEGPSGGTWLIASTPDRGVSVDTESPGAR